MLVVRNIACMGCRCEKLICAFDECYPLTMLKSIVQLDRPVRQASGHAYCKHAHRALFTRWRSEHEGRLYDYMVE